MRDFKSLEDAIAHQAAVEGRLPRSDTPEPTKISYLVGDATKPFDTGHHERFIVHVCNDVGAWGAGFTRALSRLSPRPEASYRNAIKETKPHQLGAMSLAKVTPTLFVANMIAQRGLPSRARPVVIDYAALEECLVAVAKIAADWRRREGPRGPSVGQDTMTQLSQIEMQATETLYTVEALRSDDGNGTEEWTVADRQQQPGQPRRMSYGAAIGLTESEAVEIVATLERSGCPARMSEVGSAQALRATKDFADAMLLIAQTEYEEAEEAANLAGEDNTANLSLAHTALRDAEQQAREAREALLDSDCPRQWDLREEGFEYDTITAESAEEALGIARDNCDRANYPESTGTLYIDVRVSCEETGEDASETVTLEAPAPDCEDGETHDWQSPHCLVGGLTENPGVHGNGSGVIITEVCRHCGCKRVRDTWAQNPTTGEQGLESVEYEEDAYTAEELAEAFGEE
jgi:hypothetical protein